ncbi:tRNA nucleotidyltransferase [Candidatus Parcubacteria bacterium]|nr:MAG: tRNA nucleotidyltransferase [Candidatus Parcubacteria bacterium]
MNQKTLFKTIHNVVEKERVDVYVVGGYVRDLLLGITKKKDIDFVVVGSGLEFAKKFDEIYDGEGSLVEFPDFDTARYVFTKELEDGSKEKLLEIEFAGARSESYDSASRKPKVIATSLEEDLRRRDFTVNAMARKVIASGLSSKITDPFHGQEDLKKKILRTPLNPDETFSEDPLRMMRACRFASQLGFEIEKETLSAVERNKDRLEIISAERIQEELFKLLATPQPSIGLWLLYHTGLMQKFLPEVCDLAGVEEVYGKGHKDNLNHTFRVVDNLAERSDKVLLRFAALMHDIGKPGTKSFIKGRGWAFDMHEHLGRKIVRQIGKRLRMSKDATEYIAHLVRWHQQPIALMDEGVTDSPVRRLVVNLEDNLDDLLMLCRSDITTGNPKKLNKRLRNYDLLEKRIEEVLEKDKLRAFQSPVRGEEIMQECGLKPGPTVGKIKTALEDAILDGIIPNEYEATHEYFEKIKDEYLESVEDWEKA